MLTVAVLALASVGHADTTPQAGAYAPADAPWAELLTSLGLDRMPAGATAYRDDWGSHYGSGYIELIVEADGTALLRGHWPSNQPSVTLRPGDLDAFKGAFARSGFAGGRSEFCLGLDDWVVDHHFTEAVAGEVRSTDVCGDSLADAVTELMMIASARTGGVDATPGPWWAHGPTWNDAWPDRPVPRYPASVAACAADDRCLNDAWSALLARLGMTPLPSSDEHGRAYRLILFEPGGPPKAIELSAPGCNGIAGVCVPQPMYSIRSTERPGTKDVPDGRLDAIETSFAKTDLSTMSALDPNASPCTRGSWLLEAMLYRRYRYVSGTLCSLRGLDNPLRQIAELGGVAFPH